jgi:hypothetical protein
MIGPPGSLGLNFIGLGLAAAAFWGASDFLGGLATRKARVVLVVAIAHGLSLGLSAGTFGGVALILYYQALSIGAMGLTTALTGLLTAMGAWMWRRCWRRSIQWSRFCWQRGF